ncbi:substrate-binding domain-containing protein [Nonomuraea thailandensis]
MPEDLSVIGRYSAEFAATFSLPYSHIESAPDRLGAMAVRQLVRRVESQAAREEPFVVRFISPELVSLGSTAPHFPADLGEDSPDRSTALNVSANTGVVR